MLTIPLKTVEDLPADLFAGVPVSVPVIDTGNYYPRQRDGLIEDIEAGRTESRWVERRIGHPVIKAFNTIYARHRLERGKPPGAPGRVALPVAGDDAAAKAAGLKLIDALGFDPVDAGGLDPSWRQQPGSPSYGKDFDAAALRDALAAAHKERTPQWRAAPVG